MSQTLKSSYFSVGQNVLSFREETVCWEPAVIDRHIESASLFIVKYDDDGSFGGVSVEHLQLQSKWKVGDTAIARWREDNVSMRNI